LSEIAAVHNKRVCRRLRNASNCPKLEQKLITRQCRERTPDRLIILNYFLLISIEKFAPSIIGHDYVIFDSPHIIIIMIVKKTRIECSNGNYFTLDMRIRARDWNIRESEIRLSALLTLESESLRICWDCWKISWSIDRRRCSKPHSGSPM